METKNVLVILAGALVISLIVSLAVTNNMTGKVTILGNGYSRGINAEVGYESVGLTTNYNSPKKGQTFLVFNGTYTSNIFQNDFIGLINFLHFFVANF